jgi:hypothetical protein
MAAGSRSAAGVRITYPNREPRSSHVVRASVVITLLVSVALILMVTVGGWSALDGMQALNFVWSAVYVLIAVYVWRWNRGLLPIAAALGCLLAVISLLAGIGATGTSWFDRAHAGYAPAQSLFGGAGLGANTLGVLTLLIAPVQIVLIMLCARGFAQAWNVELELPAEAQTAHG